MSTSAESSPTLSRRLAAEFVGTAFLLMAIVGSGIMGDKLAKENIGQALLDNSIATGAALVALIIVFAPVSGAHFNPVVSLSAAIVRKLPWRHLPGYILTQVAGGIAGVLLTHVMFEEPVLMMSRHARNGMGQFTAEVVASFGLVFAIWATDKTRPSAVAWVVGGYIASAYWFTSSTSFANPAVTIARTLTDTFAGIRPIDAPWFVVAQLVGAGLGILFFIWMFPKPLPHHDDDV